MQPKTLPVENQTIVRDTHSKALLETDYSALSAYKAKKRQAQNIKNIDERLNKVEDMLERVLNALESK